MKFNVTISSPSPLIALGSLIYNGTAIWLNSVWETNTIPYTIYFDGTSFPYIREPSNDLLFHAVTLDLQNEHTVVAQPATLLESIVVEMDMGDEADMMLSMDDGQLFQQDGFVATGQWTTDSCLGVGRTAGTCHVSEGSGSEISYTFEGDGITLWGAVEDHYSLYHLSMDGSDPISFAPTNNTSPRPIVVLAHYSNLGPGSHTLTLTSLPKDGKSRIEVDYAQVYTKSSASAGSTASTTGSSSSSSTSISNPDSITTQFSSTHLSKAAIIGISVAAVILALVSALALFMYKLRQKNIRKAAARRNSRQVAAGVVVEFSTRREREFDEETLASSKFSVKEGLELSVLESQQETRKPEEVAKGGFAPRT